MTGENPQGDDAPGAPSSTVVRPLEPADIALCEQVIRSLPDFFSPSSVEGVRQGAEKHGGWVSLVAGSLVGFCIVERRSPRLAEILWMAVRPDKRAHGLGTQLLTQALTHLQASGVELVEVKTLAASSGYEPYAETRRFWEHRGFIELETLDPYPGWEPGNPAVIYAYPVPVKSS